MFTLKNLSEILLLIEESSIRICGTIWKFNERVGWTEDTLDYCRKILQSPVVKFIFLYDFVYLISMSNKNHKQQITDFKFISNVFIVLDEQDRYWWK